MLRANKVDPHVTGAISKRKERPERPQGGTMPSISGDEPAQSAELLDHHRHLAPGCLRELGLCEQPRCEYVWPGPGGHHVPGNALG